MTSQMSVAEEKILNIPKEELFELCRRFSEGKMTEEEYNEEEFFESAFETRIPERKDITLEDLFVIYQMMVVDAPHQSSSSLDLWSEWVIPSRFRALSLPERLNFIETVAPRNYSTFLFNELLRSHLDLPEDSAVACVTSGIINIYDSCWSLDGGRLLKSLVKLIRLELGIQ